MRGRPRHADKCYQNSRKAPARRAGRPARPGGDGSQAGGGGSLPPSRGRRRPRWRAACDTAFKTIDKSLESWASSATITTCWKAARRFSARCSCIARTWSGSRPRTAKPNADRLREYRQSNLESVKQAAALSGAPIYADLQTALLADSLSMYLERKGYNARIGPQR